MAFIFENMKIPFSFLIFWIFYSLGPFVSIKGQGLTRQQLKKILFSKIEKLTRENWHALEIKSYVNGNLYSYQVV